MSHTKSSRTVLDCLWEIAGSDLASKLSSLENTRDDESRAISARGLPSIRKCAQGQDEVEHTVVLPGFRQADLSFHPGR